ncbi:MAG: DNA-binding response regulator [Bacillales bacterium]|jgi:DNA-binding response OmpR family regulator|nr:DNA-binding response regulator [Bacillales bacterium]
MRILVVEDNFALLESIVKVLSSDFEVDQASDGEEGLFMAMQNIYDAIVLDVMLPEKNGFEIIKTLRNEGVKTPVCFLTARDSLEDRVRGLDLGGDDYLVKPFQAAELIARVKALLRRSGSLGIDQAITYETIKLNGKEYPIEIEGQQLKLTLKQYELLEYLIQNKGAILTKEQIYDRVWGFESDTTMEIVEVFMHHIRKKLEPFGYHKEIQTVRGIGYTMKRP